MDKTLVDLGVKMIQAQERRNLLLELDRLDFSTNSTRNLDKSIEAELRSMTLEEMGISLSKTAMQAKVTDAKREVRQTTREYNTMLCSSCRHLLLKVYLGTKKIIVVFVTHI